MKLPFTVEQFMGVFEKYNLAVWPMQIVLYAIAIAATVLSLRKSGYSGRLVSLILAFMWFWTGIVYHLLFFTEVTSAALIYGAVFILQGMIFLYAGVIRQKLEFKFNRDINGAMGALFVIFALAIYPAIGYSLGHRFPHNPTFGLPCPMTIFTFGILLWAEKPIPKYAVIIPLVWAVPMGLAASMLLGVPEDLGLVAAGTLGTIMILWRERDRRQTASAQE